MRISTLYIHGHAADKFKATVHADQPSPYVSVDVENKTDANDGLTLFTPSGLTLATDYLTELRDAIQGAIDELVQMEKNWELKIDDERHKAQDKEAE